MMRKVGGRHGTAVLLRIAARAMHDAGHELYVTGNKVWLTDRVPPEYLAVVE
jgi:putative RNA 2'-phosphotransferase